MIGTDEELKIRDKQDFIDKYYVETGYDYDCEKPVDFEYIGRCKPIDLDHDGDNFVGSSDYYEFNVYDSFEEALEHHHKRIDTVELVEEGLTSEQIYRFKEFSIEKMNNNDYRAKYGLAPVEDELEK